MQNSNLKFKNKKLILFSCFLIFLFSYFLILAPKVNANSYGNYGLDSTLNTKSDGNGAKLKDVLGKNQDISTTVGKIVGAALSFIGVLFFILMVYGGFLWMTAAGNEQQVEKAQNLIIAAVIGLIVVMSAYAITAYIGGTLTA